MGLPIASRLVIESHRIEILKCASGLQDLFHGLARTYLVGTYVQFVAFHDNFSGEQRVYKYVYMKTDRQKRNMRESVKCGCQVSRSMGK